MKRCRKVQGLVRAVQKGESATLKVWGIMHNDHDSNGAYLNLGEGRYAYVGEANWKLIRNYIVNEDGEYCKHLTKYRQYYSYEKAA